MREQNPCRIFFCLLIRRCVKHQLTQINKGGFMSATKNHQQPEKIYVLTYIDGRDEEKRAYLSEDDHKDLYAWSKRIREYCEYGILNRDVAEYVIKNILELKEVKPIPHNYVARRLNYIDNLISNPEFPYLTTDVFINEDIPLEVDNDNLHRVFSYCELIENLATEVKHAISAHLNYYDVLGSVMEFHKEYAEELEKKKLLEESVKQN